MVSIALVSKKESYKRILYGSDFVLFWLRLSFRERLDRMIAWFRSEQPDRERRMGER